MIPVAVSAVAAAGAAPMDHEPTSFGEDRRPSLLSMLNTCARLVPGGLWIYLYWETLEALCALDPAAATVLRGQELRITDMALSKMKQRYKGQCILLQAVVSVRIEPAVACTDCLMFS